MENMQEVGVGKLKFKIHSYHVDFKHEITIPSLLCFMQEIAGIHAGTYGFGWSDLIKSNFFWVLSKMRLKITRLPKWEEEIELHTWSKEPELLTAFRDFEVYDADRNLIISATSLWFLIDAVRFRPQRLDSIKEHFPIFGEKHAIREKPEKIGKVDSYEKQYANKVLFSDIDMNLHVNNTRYAQWALDAFDFDFHQQHHLKDILINYTSQAKYGESYCVGLHEVLENHFVNTIFSQENDREICSVKTVWEKVK